MSNYDQYEKVLSIALPQIHSTRTPGEPKWTRTIQVTKDADQDFVITKSKVLISPSVIATDNGKFNIATFCTRVSREVEEFDTRAEKEVDLIREEWQTKLNRAVLEITRRYPGELSEMIMNAIDFTKEDS